MRDLPTLLLLLLAPPVLATDLTLAGPQSSPSHFGAVLLAGVVLVVAGLVWLKIKKPTVYAKVVASGKTVGGEIETGAKSAVAASEAGYHAAVAASAATNAASPPISTGPPITK